LAQWLAPREVAERVRRYREIACDAFRRAEDAEDEVTRAEYLSLASRWQVLALEIEHSRGLTFDPPTANEAKAVRNISRSS